MTGAVSVGLRRPGGGPLFLSAAAQRLPALQQCSWEHIRSNRPPVPDARRSLEQEVGQPALVGLHQQDGSAREAVADPDRLVAVAAVLVDLDELGIPEDRLEGRTLGGDRAEPGPPGLHSLHEVLFRRVDLRQGGVRAEEHMGALRGLEPLGGLSQVPPGPVHDQGSPAVDQVAPAGQGGQQHEQGRTAADPDLRPGRPAPPRALMSRSTDHPTSKPGFRPVCHRPSA